MESLSPGMKEKIKEINRLRGPYVMARYICFFGLFIIVPIALFIYMHESTREMIFPFLEQKVSFLSPVYSLLALAFIAWIPFCIPYIKQSGIYEVFFHEQFMPEFVASVDTFKYNGEYGINESSFEKSQIFDEAQIDGYESNMKFFSKQKQIQFTWMKTKADVSTGRERGTLARRVLKEVSPAFQGYFLTVGLPREIPSFCILPQKAAFSAIKKQLATHIFKSSAGNPVTVSIPHFKEHFQCFGTPPANIADVAVCLMERSGKLKKPVGLSVKGKELFLAIQGEENIFGIPLKEVTEKQIHLWKETLNFYREWVESLAFFFKLNHSKFFQ